MVVGDGWWVVVAGGGGRPTGPQPTGTQRSKANQVAKYNHFFKDLDTQLFTDQHIYIHIYVKIYTQLIYKLVYMYIDRIYFFHNYIACQ